jgi:hypothetical protein
MVIEYRSERESIRQAMLKAQSEWLENADAVKHTEPAVHIFATAVATAFQQEAEKYKDEKTKEMHTDAPSGFFNAGYVDSSPSGPLPEAG